MADLEQDKLLRDAEHHYDVHNFDDLYNYAVEVCLQNEPEIKPLGDDSPEAELIRKIGSRGLGTALSVQLNDNSFGFYFESPVVEDEDTNKEYITASFPMRRPHRIHRPVDTVVQSKIMAFGEQLLNEAHSSLGPDAQKMIKRYQKAETDEEQVAILEWLQTRIRGFDKSGLTWENELEDGFYHPIRLSPKALGQYPENNLKPTCLGASILATSFLQQTGSPLLHAGVMATHKERDREIITRIIHYMSKQEENAPLPDTTRQRLLKKASALADDMNSLAFHAAALVKLQSGNWYVFDPYYRSSYIASPENSTKINDTYETLQEMNTIAPGMEIPLHIGYGEVASLIGNLASDLKTTEQDITLFTKTLFQASPESLQNDVYRSVRQSIEAAESYLSERDVKNSLLLLDEEMDVENGWRTATSFSEGFSKVWESFFLQGETTEQILSRIQHDERYAKRRVEDLCTLPALTTLLSLAEFNNVEWVEERATTVHERLELGLPEYRIGAAVLGDFASYGNNPLSFTFWASHWPSFIPLTEFVDHSPDRTHEEELIELTDYWMDHFSLIYSKQNGIILKSCIDQK